MAAAQNDFDAIVVGSGQAGVPLADRLAGLGKRVLIAERKDLGGTCVNYGCTPTKTMVASARAAHVARTCARLGVHAGDVRVDLAAIVARKNAIVARWRRGVEERLRKRGDRIQMARGHARLMAERTVEVNGVRHRADTIILNVGARPAIPPIRGLEGVRWLDNARLMDLRVLPTHLLIIGGGYIGCEFGQMFRRFGAAVTIIGHGPHLLDRQDEDVSTTLEEIFRNEGIRLELSAQVESVNERDGQVVVRLAGGKEVSGSNLLVAVGRRPNTDDLGCDAAGVRVDERGFIIVDEHYRTSAAGVYAVGDVIGGPQFTHTSWDDHRLLLDVLAGRAARPRSRRAIPFTVFTDPQVAGVGLTERQARVQAIPYEVATMPFGSIARAVEVDETAGILKVLIDPRSERILGATLVGAEAGELVHIFVPLIEAGVTARAIVDAEFVHPTFAEGVQSVVMKLDRFSLARRDTSPAPTAGIK